MMMAPNWSCWAAALALMLAIALDRAEAATKPVNPPDSSPVQILPGTGSKEPISIDADKLVYYDKERKAADVRPILADKFHGATQGERAIASSRGI